MIIKEVEYSKRFQRQFKSLSTDLRKQVIKKEKLFRKNPLHSSLRLHELHGRLKNTWSISVNKNYRMIFERMDNGTIVFYSIGSHDIYKNL